MKTYSHEFYVNRHEDTFHSASIVVKAESFWGNSREYEQYLQAIEANPAFSLYSRRGRKAERRIGLPARRRFGRHGASPS